MAEPWMAPRASPGDPAGVWVAYFRDRSSIVPFWKEIDALRYAVEYGMNVRWAQFGEDALTDI